MPQAATLGPLSAPLKPRVMGLVRKKNTRRGHRHLPTSTDIYRHSPVLLGKISCPIGDFEIGLIVVLCFFTMGQRVKQNCPVVCKDDTAPAVHGYLWIKFNSVSLLLWNSNEIIVDAGDCICDICGTVYGMFNIRGMGQGWEYLLSEVKIDGQTKSKCISFAKGNQVGRVQTIHMFDSTP